LDAVDEDTLGDALTLAWQNTVDKQKTAKTPKTGRNRTIKKTLEKKSVKTTAVGKPAPARRR